MMNEDPMSLRVREIQAKIKQNLEIVQQALGIEAIDDELDEIEVEPDSVLEEAIANRAVKKLSNTERDEEKQYILDIRAANRQRLVEAQAIFTESVAKFAKSRAKFINRPKRRSHCGQSPQ